MAMKKCKECGVDVSSKAKACPTCGKDQRNFFGKHKVITFILIVFIIGLIAGINGNDSNTTTPTSIVQKQEKITLEKFNKIQTGMTYQQVVDIIGEEGTVLSESNIGDSNQYKTTMYYWYAEDGISNANVTIQGGKVISKAQIGLR